MPTRDAAIADSSLTCTATIPNKIKMNLMNLKIFYNPEIDLHLLLYMVVSTQNARSVGAVQ